MKKTKTQFTFDDLNIRQHPHFNGGIQGIKFFDNGYGISVINGRGAYVSNDSEFEIAVLFGNEDKFELSYNTPLTNDVIGHLTKNEVEEYMNKIAELK